MIVWYLKALALILIVLFVCPLVFIGLAATCGRFFGLTIAPDSFVVKAAQRFNQRFNR
ncbi:MAG: hypothetical protein WC365_06505 [Candidatus Babeliales bacterium]|jgi:hypothetical protein